AQGPPRRAGGVPLPEWRSHSREGGSGEAAQGDAPLTHAAESQYPALKGLLMRSAMGDTSTSLSVGIFSPDSALISMP
ncbi:hypothetical protein, partial [Paracidovorax sp. MALMAid1276]|uniref:hypothetical protein n=1 Tax=Paracidovorax sp. MALMAid1276 TaxID=3411631 RepID=UPI003B9C9B4E